MSVMHSYNASDMESAGEFVALTMDEYTYLLALVPGAWSEARQTGDVTRFLSIRYSLTEYICAAYASANAGIFLDASNALLAHPLSACGVAFVRKQLGFDLALAISCGKGEQARELARTILLASPSSDQTDTDEHYAHIAALLVDMQFFAAQEAALTLATLAQKKSWPRKDCLDNLAWTAMVRGLVTRDAATFADAVHTISAARRSMLQRLLSRWRNGQNVELSVTDFWDWKTTSLLALASDFGMDCSMIDAEAMIFCDAAWTRNPARWA
jgi:hypothetical protein